jgi:hypothetical protein
VLYINPSSRPRLAAPLLFLPLSFIMIQKVPFTIAATLFLSLLACVTPSYVSPHISRQVPLYDVNSALALQWQEEPSSLPQITIATVCLSHLRYKLYNLLAVEPGMCLTAPDSATDNGGLVTLEKCGGNGTDSPCQAWYFNRGQVQIHGNMCLDVPVKGFNLEISECSATSDNQKFYCDSDVRSVSYPQITTN